MTTIASTLTIAERAALYAAARRRDDREPVETVSLDELREDEDRGDDVSE